jgi:hypothetical protein
MCVSRPQKFGKSMGVNMLVAYYSKGCDSRDLFSNLRIANYPDFETHLNKYNVISLNISKFKEIGKDSDTILPSIISKLKQELKEEFPQIIDKINRPLLLILSEIYRQTKEKFIIFIDEWDYLLREANKPKVREDYLDYLMTLFKDSPYIKLAYLTGVLPVKKYNPITALNIFDEYSMVRLGRMAEYFGFTAEEVRAMCDYFKRDFDEMKSWYGGYFTQKNVNLFNPRSVIKSFVEEKLKGYCFSTYYLEALRTPINKDLRDLRKKLFKLISGAKVSAAVSDFQSDVDSIRYCDEILTLLVHMGYLAYDETTKELYIPNLEISEEFDKSIKLSDWKEMVRTLKDSDNLLKATLNCNGKIAEVYISKAYNDFSSIFKLNSEETLGAVVPLAYSSAIRYYTFMRYNRKDKGIKSFILFPNEKINMPLIFIELKFFKATESAVVEIKQKIYPESMKNYSGGIILVSLIYDEKKCSCVIEKIIKTD